RPGRERAPRARRLRLRERRIGLQGPRGGRGVGHLRGSALSVIKTSRSGIAPGSPLVIDLYDPASSAAIRIAPAPSVPSSGADADRADDLASHLDFLWRFACRMGVGSAAAEDIAHEAFLIALARVASITPGKERSFLVSV